MIDRALVAAYDAGMKPLLCLTKADLADPETLLSTYRSLGVPWVVTQRGGDLTELRDRLRDRTSVLIGSSGVGKSTLVNALVPTASATSGSSTPSPVAAGTPPRRRTCCALPDGEGWIIDTPGIRSFGLAHVQPERADRGVPRPRRDDRGLPRGCTHGGDEPECGLDEAVAAGEADPERVESFRRLLAARSEPATSVPSEPQTARAPASPVRTTSTSVASAATASSAWSTDPERAPALVRGSPRRARPRRSRASPRA